MTYAEFLQRLAETPRDWRVTQYGAIRRGVEPWQCPLMACAHMWTLETDGMARALGLPTDMAYMIACIADNIGSKQPFIRADLLRACGLED